MQESLDKYLCEKFPKVFRDRHASMETTAMCWGLAVGDGWYTIIGNACSIIQNHIDWTRKQRANALKFNRALKRALNGDDAGLKRFYQYGDEPLNEWRLEQIVKDIEQGEFKIVPHACPQVVAVQVKEKFGCYDEQTEVLTKAGWKYFKDCTATTEFATLGADDQLEYAKPIDLIDYEYTGPMYRLQARGVDLLVTPNHNMYWAKGNTHGRFSHGNTRKWDFEFGTPATKFHKPKRFLKSLNWIGQYQSTITIPGYQYTNTGKTHHGTFERTYNKPDQVYRMDSFLKLLGLILSEGHIDKQKGQIAIAACNDGSTKAVVEQQCWEAIIQENGFPIAKPENKHQQFVI